MSAELGLAIAGVAATGAALSKALFGIYHSIRHASRDVRDIATQLTLLQSVLKELKRALRTSKSIYSADATRTIYNLLSQCSQVFDGIEDLTAPLRSADGDPLLHPPLGERLKFHFKKDDMRLLKGQLDSLKSTIHLMVSIIQLGRELPTSSSTGTSGEQTSPQLRSALYVASELVVGERACLADLLLIEEQVYASSTDGVKFARISAWLSEVVGLSAPGSMSYAQSTTTAKSVWTLSAAQRSITGSATEDVEMLLEKWTTVSEAQPGDGDNQGETPHSTASTSDRNGHIAVTTPAGDHPSNTAPSKDSEQDSARQPESHSSGSESDSDTESDSDSDSQTGAPLAGHIRALQESALVDTDGSDSSSSGTATPTAERLSAIEHVEGPATPTLPMSPGPEALLTPILVSHGDNDDNETIRDLRRASHKDRRVRIDLPTSPDESSLDDSRIEDWIASSALSDDGGNISFEPPPNAINMPYRFHSPFSQVSILSSQAPSVSSSISSICEDEPVPRKIHKLIKMGNNLIRLKKYSEAASLFKDAYNLSKANDEVDNAQIMEIKFKTGVIFGELGKYASAVRVLRDVLNQQLGENPKQTQLTKHYLARIYCRREEWREASKMYKPLWDLRKSILRQQGAIPSQVGLALRTGQEYGHALLGHNRFDVAADVLGTVYDRSTKVHGTDDVKITLDTGVNLGRALRCLGKISDASKILIPIHRACAIDLEDAHSLALRCAHELAMVYSDQGNYRECEPLARSVWEIMSKLGEPSTPSKNHDFTLDSAECLATALRGLNRNSEARDMFTIALQGLSEKFGRSHSRTVKVTDQLSDILLELEEEYDAERRMSSALIASRPITHENITEDLTHIAEKLGPLLLKQDKKADAADVYDSVFVGEKKFLGIDSVLTLTNGHKYGALCLDLKRLPTAETVLVEVWNHRKEILGEKDQESLASGFQLGQAYFMNNNFEAAVAIHQSILDLRAEVFGLVSAEVIESSEVLGTMFTSSTESFEHGFQLLQNALESKKQLYGNQSTTFSSALRLASLSAGHGKFPNAADICSWIFENRGGQSAKWKAIANASALTAAGFEFIQQRHLEGNQLVRHAVSAITQDLGETSSTARTLAYSQAFLLLLQRHSREGRHILHRQFSLQKRIRGAEHKTSLLAGEVLAIGTLVDSVLKRTKIGEEIDKVHDWLFARKRDWTLAMRFAMAAALICATLKLDEIAKAILSWLHRTQKRLFGRFDRDTLVTLAIHHALHLQRLYKRARKIPTKDHSAIDPRVLVPKIWPSLTRGIGTVLTKMTTGKKRSKFFTTWLPKLMTEWTLYEGYRRERLARLFMAQMPQFEGFQPFEQFLSSEFADNASRRSRARSPEDDVASRVWTVASSELGDGDDRDAVDGDNSSSIDFSEIIDERTAERLRSLGDSLLDLTMESSKDEESLPRGGDEEGAEERLKNLQSELVNEVVNEAGINAAKENYEAFERETDSV